LQTTIPVDRIESVVDIDQTAGHADTLHNPAGLKIGIAAINTVTASVRQAQ